MVLVGYIEEICEGVLGQRNLAFFCVINPKAFGFTVMPIKEECR